MLPYRGKISIISIEVLIISVGLPGFEPGTFGPPDQRAKPNCATARLNTQVFKLGVFKLQEQLFLVSISKANKRQVL